MRLRFTSGLAVVCAVSLSGCSAHAPELLQSEPVAFCAPSDRELAVSVYAWVLEESVTVTDIALVDSSNVELTEAYVVPILDSSYIGAVDNPPETAAWAQRVDLVGSTLTSTRKGPDMSEWVDDIAIVVRPSLSDVGGSFRGVRISYVSENDAQGDHVVNMGVLYSVQDCADFDAFADQVQG